VHKFVRELITEWRRLKLPFENATVVAALSGGADSLALLLALGDLRERKKLELRIVAAHFNHRLRGRESEADEDFVKQVAAERKFELAIGHGELSRESNLEQNARTARYEFLRSTAQNVKASHVLTAHTQNDQAETFLLNLIRGSGVGGLAGMRPVRTLSAECGAPYAGPEKSAPGTARSALLLARPLLRWARREDTENFCREMGVEFRYDTMNEDMSFKRVRVRKMLLPMLKEFNPRIIETLAQTSELMARRLEPLDTAGGRDQADAAAKPPKVLFIQELTHLETGELHQTIRTWLAMHRGSLRSIGLKHVEAIEQLAFSTKSGRVVELPGSGRVRRSNGQLVFENIKVDK
jgi:tRNA(Ile)-lysidine synthase